MNRAPLTVEEKLSKAKITCVREMPFFGMLILACEFVEDPGTGTMWADGKRIGYDPAFVEACEIGELAWTLAHEAMHNAFGHVTRRGARHPRIHNYATDYFINGALWTSMDGKTLVNFKEPDLGRILDNPELKARAAQGEPTVLRDVERFGEMSSDEIYAVLIKELINAPIPGSGGGSGDGEPDFDPLSDADGLGGDLNYEKAKEAGHDSAAKAKELDEFWKGQVASSATAAKKMGKLPAGFERFIDQLVNPTVPWQEALQHFVQPMPMDFAFHVPDRRFLEEDFILPDFTGEYLRVAVAVDTSGSVSAKELQQYISDTAAILRSFERVEGVFIGCDAQVHDYHKIGPEDPVPSRIGGGGGTSFIPVFRRIEEENFEPHVLVYFTDGYGSFPAEPPKYPVVWMMVNTPVEAPFGEQIRVQTS
ncbi:vWA domain-containing protein [Deinococcus kurensis]|uniref:vWA domain-containing protein n=1 Tax=Deinococcus kurensis TaxID=2662757 RepID=UPI0012D2D303|nr:VWA-like domain-containing protein [Deinococcus kurensis]